MKLHALRLTLFCLLIPALLHAASNAGAFLDKGLSPRSTGMGNAQVANARDSDAIYWNPARLTSAKPSIAIQGANAYETDYFGLAGIMHVKDIPIGFNFTQASITGFNNSTLNTSTGRHELTGSQSSYLANAYTLSSAYSLSAQLSLGASIKLITEKAAGYSADGIGIDLAGQYQLNQHTQVGLLLQNAVRPQLKWNTPAGTTESLPFRLKLGLAHQCSQALLIAIDVTHQENRDLRLNYGVEYALSELFDLYGGFDNGNLSLGTGLNLHPFEISFSWTNPKLHIVDDVYRFGFSYSY